MAVWVTSRSAHLATLPRGSEVQTDKALSTEDNRFHRELFTAQLSPFPQHLFTPTPQTAVCRSLRVCPGTDSWEEADNVHLDADNFCPLAREQYYYLSQKSPKSPQHNGFLSEVSRTSPRSLKQNFFSSSCNTTRDRSLSHGQQYASGKAGFN